MIEQRFIRFAVVGDLMADVAAQTDASAPWTIRIDDGVATVGFRGDLPPIASELDLIPGPTGLVWSRDEVLAVLPVSPGPEP